MPELPEVETVARGIDLRVRGCKIVSVWLGSKPEPFRSRPEEIVAALTGSTIQHARRVGKHIVVDLVRDEKRRKKSGSAHRSTKNPGWRGQWIIHLGMTGRLLVTEPDVPLPPHTHVVIQLEDQREIRFMDARRFGRLAVLELSTAAPLGQEKHGSPTAKNRSKARTAFVGSGFVGSGFVGSGQEPLDISPEAFRAVFRGRKAPIKSALLNQSLLQGVGNIYADESLFRAGLRPRRRAGGLTGKESARLRTALQTVLREAIAAGGSSVSDYVDADGARGFFQLEHKVYLRGGEPCLVCKSPIRRIVLGGRGTHFCPQCQH